MGRWHKRELSNYEYLLALNAAAGRSFNDIVQYPVMPWVVADYTSDFLDFDQPDTFRDLAKVCACRGACSRRPAPPRHTPLLTVGSPVRVPAHRGAGAEAPRRIARALRPDGACRRIIRVKSTAFRGLDNPLQRRTACIVAGMRSPCRHERR